MLRISDEVVGADRAGEPREPWLTDDWRPGTTSQGSQLRRKSKLGTIAAISVVLVASVVLLRLHREQIRGFVKDFKSMFFGQARSTDSAQPDVVATGKGSKPKLFLRGPGPAKDREGQGAETSIRGTAGLEGSAITPLKELEPLQLHVQEHDNQRRTVELRSGPVVRLR